MLYDTTTATISRTRCACVTQHAWRYYYQSSLASLFLVSLQILLTRLSSSASSTSGLIFSTCFNWKLLDLRNLENLQGLIKPRCANETSPPYPYSVGPQSGTAAFSISGTAIQPLSTFSASALAIIVNVTVTSSAEQASSASASSSVPPYSYGFSFPRQSNSIATASVDGTSSLVFSATALSGPPSSCSSSVSEQLSAPYASTTPASTETAYSSGSQFYSYGFATISDTAAPSLSSLPVGTASSFSSKVYSYSFPNSTVGPATTSSVTSYGFSSSSGFGATSIYSSSLGRPTISSGQNYTYSFPRGSTVSSISNANISLSTEYLTSYLTSSLILSTKILTSKTLISGSSVASSGKHSSLTNATTPTSSNLYHGPTPPPLTLTSITKDPGTAAFVSGTAVSSVSSNDTTGIFSILSSKAPSLPFYSSPSFNIDSTVIESSIVPTALSSSSNAGSAISTSVTSRPSTISEQDSSKFTYIPSTRLMPSEYYTHPGKKPSKHHHESTPTTTASSAAVYRYLLGYGFGFGSSDDDGSE